MENQQEMREQMERDIKKMLNIPNGMDFKEYDPDEFELSDEIKERWLNNGENN